MYSFYKELSSFYATSCNPKHDILEQKYEEWIDVGKDYPIIYYKFRRYLEKMNNDVVMKKIKEEMKFVLYNNRNVVKKIK